MLFVAAVALPLLLLLVVTTIRSIMSGVKFIRDRVRAITEAMIGNLVPGMRSLASGDFTVHLSAKTKPTEITRQDELGEIMHTTEEMRTAILVCYEAYNQSTDQLRDVIAQVSSTALSIDGASQQMATSSGESGRATAEVAQAIEHVAQGAERQVRMMEDARNAADEVAAAVSQSAEQAEQTAEVAARARENAQQGVAAAEKANEAMRSVTDSSHAVSAEIGELAAKSEQSGAGPALPGGADRAANTGACERDRALGAASGRAGAARADRRPSGRRCRRASGGADRCQR